VSARAPRRGFEHVRGPIAAVLGELAGDRLLKWREACALLNCSRSTLYTLPVRRIKVGARGVRWPLRDLMLYIGVHTQDNRREARRAV
jgi:predicted DNA-binding transcriptional regulator AlpA